MVLRGMTFLADRDQISHSVGSSLAPVYDMMDVKNHTIIDRLFALPINLFTILRIMPLINSHPLDLFRVSACRLDDNGGFLAYAPSPLLDIFAIFATINLGGLLCVSRMK